MHVTRRAVLEGLAAGAVVAPLAAALPASASPNIAKSRNSAGKPAEQGASKEGTPPLDGSPLSDEEFFGVWDEAANAWSAGPCLDYSRGELHAVESAAKQADYSAAGEELLDYSSVRGSVKPPDWAYNGIFRDGLIPLFCDHIFTLGKGEIYVDTFTIGTSEESRSIDVTEQVNAARDAGGIGFMLMARRKSEALATFASRHANSGKPTLEITTSATTAPIEAEATTYIAAGPDPTAVHGSEETLRVRDSGTGPFSENTAKAYLWFDLGAANEEMAQVSLRLTGSASESMEIIVYEVKETFKESERAWSNTVQNTFSWQGDPGGYDWYGPEGSDAEYSYQLPRFYFAGPMADSYADSGDETVAAALISQMTDFIADTDETAADKGAAGFPRNLDSATRYRNWCYAYEILRTSPSLDAEANTAIWKAFARAGAYLNTTTANTPNWMITIKSALLYIGGCMPELAAASAWREQAQAYLAKQLSDAMYPDGGYMEASSTYARGVALSFVTNAGFCADNGYPFDGSTDLHRLSWFLADQAYPNGFDPAYGDSSYTNQSKPMGRLADLFDDDELRYAVSQGTTGTKPSHGSVVYPDTRVAIQRTGWKNEDWYLRLNADRGAHWHPDEMAVQIYAHDRPLIPAMGCFTYSDDPKGQWLRRTTQSHSTVMIDGKAQEPTAAGAVENLLKTGPIQLVQGWTDSTAGVRHSRKAVLLGGGTSAGFWLIYDHLKPSDRAEHSYEQNWHLLPEAKPELSGLEANTHFGSGTNLQILPLLTSGLTGSIAPGYYSRRTYEVTDSKYVSYSKTARGSVHLLTALVPRVSGVASSPLALSNSSSGVLEVRGPDGSRIEAHLGGGPRSSADGFSLAQESGDKVLAISVNKRDVTWRGRTLLRSDRPMPAVALAWDKRSETLEIDTAEPLTRQRVRFNQPMKRVRLNGRTVSSSRRGTSAIALGGN